MRNRKLFLALALVALIIATFASGSSHPTKAAAKYTIGISNGFVGSEWRTQMLQNLDDAAKAYKDQGIDVTLVVESKDVDVQGQIQQIQNLINRKVNAIIVNPNDIKALNPILEDAVDQGIVVISIDQEISAKGVYNVVIDQTEWARISARWLAEALGGKGDVVLIEGFVGHPANEARMAGVKEVFDKYPGIKIVGRDSGKWDQATGQKVMSDFLASIPNIDGVWTQDGMATGVLTAINTANPKKFPITTGEARASYLTLWKQVLDKHPDFKSIGVVNPPGIATSGLRVAIELLGGAKVNPAALSGASKNTLYVPIPYVVDPKNFADYLAKYGSQPASYTLDGIITQDDAKALIAGKMIATPAATMSAGGSATMAATKSAGASATMAATMSATMAATAAK